LWRYAKKEIVKTSVDILLKKLHEETYLVQSKGEVVPVLN